MSKPINLCRSEGEPGWWEGGRPVLLRALPKEEFDAMVAVVLQARKLASKGRRQVQDIDLWSLCSSLEWLDGARRRARRVDLDP